MPGRVEIAKHEGRRNALPGRLRCEVDDPGVAWKHHHGVVGKAARVVGLYRDVQRQRCAVDMQCPSIR